MEESSPPPFQKGKSHKLELQKKYDFVNKMAFGMTMEKVKKLEVERKA